MTLMKSLFADRRGATAIEYALLAALIGAAMMAALQNVGLEFGNTMNTASTAMSTQNAAA
ncbi:MAG: Flp family type IVb pilin [Novosphingobium sp.]|uniref:Flp family type IVb pilin n=1 Tax=Novosphingobium sp. TaxID=1874826 RepID=UPI001DDFF868|nr:Flp family type IVb pilin [Novosphingobium sp.]MCB2056604.1 Flp family type IVb pilin [Novosphingobium sp.]MCP5386494.1 Flp family type IVb pilin [Novosphingobium sp.]